MLWPITVPSSTFIAANRVVVPLRLSSWVMVPARPLFIGRPGSCAVERLDLALLVDGKHDGVRRGIDIEPDDVAQLVDEGGVVGQLELPDPMRWSP